ncbi:hypothetical protein CCR75_005865 [Bremia lactucae]|uniref:BED-type domain-containing protein n=1 Tax=Bremia lactucae TaxID=4779 RepID=A0A976FGA8_BRELC|nr:hypothetical protein CCR75_005865 [Bremia lactucae]
MGRKLSNVYDYFFRLESEPGRKGLVRYQCKKCDKQYASNATRLAEHLKMSCAPSFQTNQRARAKALLTGPPGPPYDEKLQNEGTMDENEDLSENIMATEASLASQSASTDAFATAGVETAQSLALKRADQQLLSSMLESESDPPQDMTEVLLRLAKLSTCVLGDAMAQLKIQGHLVTLELLRGYDTPLTINICGPALTVQIVPITGATVGLRRSYDYVDTAEMGQVVVISAPTGITSAVFGGLLATAAKARNVAGIVTDGRVRDVQALCRLNFPAFASGTSVHGEWGSTAIGEVNCPIVVAGCVVRQNDIIRGDVNGVIVIPAERAQEIVMRAEVIEDQDHEIVQALNEGLPLQRSLYRVRSSRDI